MSSALHTPLTILLVAICLFLPSLASAQDWATEDNFPDYTQEEPVAEERQAEQSQKSAAPTPDQLQHQEPNHEQVHATRTAHTGLIVAAQAGGLLITNMASYSLGLFLLLFGAFGGYYPAAYAGIAVMALSPVFGAIAVNGVGILMGAGNHFWWTLGGAALGLLGAFGFLLLSEYAHTDAFLLPAFLLPPALTIGGYHLGRHYNAQQSPTLSLSPLIGPTHAPQGAMLNLRLSF